MHRKHLGQRGSQALHLLLLRGSLRLPLRLQPGSPLGMDNCLTGCADEKDAVKQRADLGGSRPENGLSTDLKSDGVSESTTDATGNTLRRAAEACRARARRASMAASMRRVSFASSPRIAFSTSRKLAFRCATSRRWLAACEGGAGKHVTTKHRTSQSCSKPEEGRLSGRKGPGKAIVQQA